MSNRVIRLEVPSARAAGHGRHVSCRKCNAEMEPRKEHDYLRWHCTNSNCGYVITHPEFLDFVAEIAKQVTTTINAGAPQIESDMPYKSQYSLELLIEMLEDCV